MSNREHSVTSSILIGSGGSALLSAGAQVARVQELSDRSWHAGAAAIELAREIEGFSSLPEDWDGEGALQIAPAAIRAAIRFIERMTASMNTPMAYPNPNGTLTLCWRWRSGRAELEIGRTRHSWIVVDRSGLSPKRTSCSGDNEKAPLLGMTDLWAAIGNSSDSPSTGVTVGLAMLHEWARAA